MVKLLMPLYRILYKKNIGKKHQQLANVLNQIYCKKEDDDYSTWKSWYVKENRADIALSDLLFLLSRSPYGKRKIKWLLFNKEINRSICLNFEAYSIDLETWQIMKLIAADTKGNSEGYTFEFQIKNKQQITLPNSICPVSSTDTIIGNCIDSNSDTWGTAYGVRSQSLYAFFIKDIKVYAFVKVSYWCL